MSRFDPTSTLIFVWIYLELDVQLFLITLLLTQPPQETNTVRIVAGTGFKLYQILISPSQGDVCNFSPSCSHFAKEAIERYGIIWGSLMATDRLQRCNPWALRSVDKYYTGFKDRKIYDPVKDNYIFGKIAKDDPE